MKKAKQEPLSPYLDEREQQIQDDYEWCWHNPTMQKKYGGRAVVVHKRKVWGVGKNHQEAWAEAQQKPGCPSKGVSAFVVMSGSA
jgi:hypothetical protein